MRRGPLFIVFAITGERASKSSSIPPELVATRGTKATLRLYSQYGASESGSTQQDRNVHLTPTVTTLFTIMTLDLPRFRVVVVCRIYCTHPIACVHGFCVLRPWRCRPYKRAFVGRFLPHRVPPRSLRSTHQTSLLTYHTHAHMDAFTTIVPTKVESDETIVIVSEDSGSGSSAALDRAALALLLEHLHPGIIRSRYPHPSHDRHPHQHLFRACMAALFYD
uniref:Secreted protein n=1 Tax=Mycena chlorophos TaxID=658473 RepID=A0ABQ0LP45_MYCCL|nr:predicted protein [Mycena chlorophos]